MTDPQPGIFAPTQPHQYSLEYDVAATSDTGAGGAHMLTRKWVHDLDAFNALAVGDQERVIGRTKKDSIELEGDAMPATSHVSRTDVKVDGIPQRLYRRSFPYGSVSQQGLYFLAFCKIWALSRIRMAAATGSGGADQIQHQIDAKQNNHPLDHRSDQGCSGHRAARSVMADDGANC